MEFNALYFLLGGLFFSWLTTLIDFIFDRLERLFKERKSNKEKNKK